VKFLLDWTRCIARIVRVASDHQVEGSNPSGPCVIMSFFWFPIKKGIMMKIRKEEIQKMVEEPIGLFYQGIRSSYTKLKYTLTLRKVLCDIFEDVLDGSFEERASQLVHKGKADPQWTTSLLLTLSKKLRERTELSVTEKEYL